MYLHVNSVQAEREVLRVQVLQMEADVKVYAQKGCMHIESFEHLHADILYVCVMHVYIWYMSQVT